MASKLHYITNATLRTWLDMEPESVAIVDVRDQDYFGGHIRNSINIPSETFYAKIAELEQKISTKPKVVFHCMLSQQRGPSCAAAYARSLDNKGKSQEIYVLQGGFAEWARKYGADPNYTVGFYADLH